MSGRDEGAGAVWTHNYRLQGAPQSSWGEPDQRPARSQRVTSPTACRSRWQPWGDSPGTECDILGVTGRHVGMRREQAGPRAHPSRFTARSISLKGQPSAYPSPAQNSSVAAHHPLNRGQKRRHRSAFQVLPRPAPGYLTDPSPASPFQNPLLQPNGFVVLQTSSSVSPPPPRLCSYHFISLGMSFPHSLLLFSYPCLSLPTLQAHLAPHLPEASLTDLELKRPNFSLNGQHFT